MLQNRKEDLLLSLVSTLSGSRVEPGCIAKALALICQLSPLERGAVYEVDLSGNFYLSEHYSPLPTAFPACLQGEDLVVDDPDYFAQEDLLYFVKGTQNTAFEQRLFELYAAPSLLLAPVVDEDNTLYGFVLLFASSTNPTLEASTHSILSVALSLLSHYIGLRMYQRKIHQTQLTMESILDNTGIDIYVNDFYTHEVLYVNKSMAAPYGGREAFMEQKCWNTLFPSQNGPCSFCPQKMLIDSNGEPTKVYTWDYQRTFDGAWFRVFSAAFQWVDGRLAHVVSSADITENKRNEALVEKLANYDELTNLPNRRMLLKKCLRCIDNATAIEQGYLLFFDIDGFKAINDSLGHDSGDEFLIQLGAFFSSIPMLKDSIYRNGGDEFVALLGGESMTKSHIKNLLHVIQARFQKPWILKKGDVHCGTSIGIACYPEDGVTAEALLQKADMAMYQVKKAGGGGFCFGYQLNP